MFLRVRDPELDGAIAANGTKQHLRESADAESPCIRLFRAHGMLCLYSLRPASIDHLFNVDHNTSVNFLMQRESDR